MNTVKGIFSKKSDEWETPSALFDEYDRRYDFTLDPCCTHDNAKCEKHYTIDENGLEQDWTNEVIMVTCETGLINYHFKKEGDE